MSSETPNLHCYTLPYDLFSQEQALMPSFESTTGCFPAPPLLESPTRLPDMSSDGRTMLELYDARAFFNMLCPASENGLTVATNEIIREPEAAGQVTGSLEEQIQHRVSDSTESQWLYMGECSPKHTADPHFAHEIINLQLQRQVEGRTISRPGFECQYDDCRGKNGRKRLYARAEHRNRHEKTVHHKTANAGYRCWVRNCRSRSFNRADNLKAHLKDRHGRKSRAGRYQYIATLDETSSYYNPKWTGDVTNDGLPK